MRCLQIDGQDFDFTTIEMIIPLREGQINGKTPPRQAIACRYRIRVLFDKNAIDLGFPQFK